MTTRPRAMIVLAALAVPLRPTVAGADVGARLAAVEAEAARLGRNLPEPHQIGATRPPRRLVDAEVAFALGDYSAAALILFDLVGAAGPKQDTAIFLLAESLFLRGDKGAARAYYAQLAGRPNSRHYQPALLRLLEIAIALRDSTDLDPVLGALDRLPPSARAPDVHYVRGKYAFAQGHHDEAIAYFRDVPAGSPREMQAAYYTATTLVAKQDYAGATALFTELIARRPGSSNDRRVIELSQLALGRLYYERDQLAKSIDSYLLVDRRSTLFPDALYEISWVYVKSKQFDKALRALELLAQSEPQSTKTPTVRILEGNLRIRKAQLIRLATITGTLPADAKVTDPDVEYEKALAVFAETHAAYQPSYQSLARMVDDRVDPAQHLAQIAGRPLPAFAAHTPLPDAAAAYLREEPEVQRLIAVERDLGDVEANLAQADATIARLDGLVATNDRAAAFPALRSRRARLGELQDALIAARNELADQQLALVTGPVESASRRALAAQHASRPSAEHVFAQRAAEAHRRLDGAEEAIAGVRAALDTAQATAVAVRTHAHAQAEPPRDTIDALDAAAAEAVAIDQELAALEGELALGRDLAGTGDRGAYQARELRAQLRVAQDREHRALAALAGSSRDRKRSQRLVRLAEQAARVGALLAQTEAKIDAIAGTGLARMKQALAQERASLAEIRRELAEHEAEARAIGGAILGASLRDVKARFYDIVIRSDVGTVDVAWSRKEDDDDDLKRLNLSRQRDLKQLRDEFKGIVDPERPERRGPP